MNPPCPARATILTAVVQLFPAWLEKAVLALASFSMRKEDANFPIGKTRLETIGVIACAIIMGLASYEVLQSATMQLYNGFAKHVFPELDFGLLMYVVLGTATAIKVPLYFYCIALKDISASMIALAEDHRCGHGLLHCLFPRCSPAEADSSY